MDKRQSHRSLRRDLENADPTGSGWGHWESTSGSYDLRPVKATHQSPSFVVDPWGRSLTGRNCEKSEDDDCHFETGSDDDDDEEEEYPRPLTTVSNPAPSPYPNSENIGNSIIIRKYSADVSISPTEIHDEMDLKKTDMEHLKLLAEQLNLHWNTPDDMATPALARRIRDFKFAQEKRRKKYGNERPWGVLGLYDHLSSIRTDVEWAEDAARRRANGEPYQSWADFDEKKKSGANRPFFTYWLLFVCTAMLIASIAVNGWKVEPLAENPMIGPSAETLVKMGAKDSELIVQGLQIWRLLSATVLHAGLAHFCINMLALWFVGGAIETSHGWMVSTIIFLLSAIGGTILSAIFLPEYITVGASGGIFGFIGSCLADIVINWKLLFSDVVTENRKRQSHIAVVAILILDILLNSIIGLTPYVDNFTHLGGLVYGLLCGMSTMVRLSTDFFGMSERWCTKAKHFVLKYSGLIIAIAAITGTFVVLMQTDGNTTPCPSCVWLSCVPFPPWTPADSKWWFCDSCGSVTADLVQNPELRLDLQCPSGSTVQVDLSQEEDVSTTVLQMNLPSYCRHYCLDGTDLNATYKK